MSPIPRTPPQPHAGDSLIDRCRAGDRRALRELFDLHLERVRRILRRLLGNHPDLDDLTQTVFIECFRSLHSYRGEALFGTWLSRICVRTAQRRFGDRVRAPVSLEVCTADEPGEDPRPSLERRDQLRRLGAIVSALPPKLRVAYVLHVIEGHTLNETAAILSRSTALVTLRVRAAQREIERRVQEDPGLRPLLEPEAGR
ncbi:MAG: RNA polymerase sigma factor [Deltaproteobacteria bacterium]|nr:RNA polymerase sigma factor [Deltaproteobacteria bacterium]